jgi:AcrR family transcriptional regulator
MDNTTRSERSRNAIIQAALAIIARDGPRRLTLDAIARESGISKGGLMHQFRSKEAVLKALLEYQTEYFEKFSQDYMAQVSAASPEAHLATQIAVAREAVTTQQSVAFAILGAISEEPGLLSAFKEIDAKKIAAIKAEAADPELAMLRWYAAKGLLLTALFGLCPLSDEERQRLFERLLDSKQWLIPRKD